MEGNKFGAHRVLEPKGVLPQPALRVDNTMVIYDNEILSTSIRSTWTRQASRRSRRLKAATCEDGTPRLGHHRRAWQDHNPDTGSGGMLLGTVGRSGRKLRDAI